jgi:hypothetical protein
MMSAFASGWNVIVRKKTLEVGHLPWHRPVSQRSSSREQTLGDGAEPELLEQGLPYLNGIEFHHGLCHGNPPERRVSSPVYPSGVARETLLSAPFSKAG